jgi:protein ImuA
VPAPSAPPQFDERAPGPPRWRLVLEKGSLDPRRRGTEGEEYLVDWTEHGFALADDTSGTGRPSTDRPAVPAGAALSGADSAALGDRLSQAG